MSLYEQLGLKPTLPALAPSDVLMTDEHELLQSILADCELDDLVLPSDDSDQEGAGSPSTRSAKRQRKRTYEQRKDDIDTLESKAQLLSVKLAFLKHRAGVQ